MHEDRVLDSAAHWHTRRNPAAAGFAELDVVTLTTDAYAGDGLSAGEEGTVVLVHDGGGDAYEVEFANCANMFPLNVKTVNGGELSLVKKWRG